MNSRPSNSDSSNLLKVTALLRSLILTAAMLISFPPSTVSAADSSEMLVYFGTYTGGKSKGIYVSRFDGRTGKLGEPALAAETSSPSFLAIHPDGKHLYAVNEVADFQGKRSGAVTGYSIESSTGRLSQLNQQPSIGDGPCHIIVDKAGAHVIVANYGGGSTTVLPVGKDRRLGAASAFVQHTGSSVNKSRQEKPHAHCATLDNANRFAFIADLGLDQVLVFKYDSAKGTIVANNPPGGVVPAGSGPRHFAFDPKNNHGYVINEITCTLTAFKYDASKGALQPIQTVSTLPAGESMRPEYSTAEIEVHPGGKFVYGSNRGHNTIAVFGIDEASGKVSLVQHQSTLGKIPRSFGIDPSGRWLLAANQESDSVAVFAIDSVTGKLASAGQTITVGKPVCVKFVATH